MMKKSILFGLGLLSLAPAWGDTHNEINDAAQNAGKEIADLPDFGKFENPVKWPGGGVTCDAMMENGQTCNS